MYRTTTTPVRAQRAQERTSRSEEEDGHKHQTPDNLVLVCLLDRPDLESPTGNRLALPTDAGGAVERTRRSLPEPWDRIADLILQRPCALEAWEQPFEINC